MSSVTVVSPAARRPALETSSPLVGIAFPATIGVGAFLLFALQPMIGKYILPWFGGSPAVWTTCMLFFQLLLLGGYGYAYLNITFLPRRMGAIVHVVLLVAALLFLPITPSDAWKPTSADHPALRIIQLLAVTVGAPYLILSATGPLLQAWFTAVKPGVAPYRLYALSNLGSLLALGAYPVVIEPLLARGVQTRLWSAAFVLFAVICGSTALAVWKHRETPDRPAKFRQKGEPGIELPAAMRWLWLALPAVASLLLLAVTATLCEEVAVIPFLWVLPLGLYLLSFVICFDGSRWYLRKTFAAASGIFALLICWLLTGPTLDAAGTPIPLPVQIALYCAALFCFCMTCHGELVRLKPPASRLTLFYLLISAGGALGGVFAAVIAPLVFNTLAELPIGLAILCLLVTFCLHINAAGKLPRRHPLLIAGGVVSAGVVVATFCMGTQTLDRILTRGRNFYGIYRVTEGQSENPSLHHFEFSHNGVIHGMQFVDPNARLIPTLYFTPSSGAGLVLDSFRPHTPRHVGIVGMGMGTLAAYGQKGDSYRFYEIDPDIIQLARTRFTYLSDSRADVQVLLGDARLKMEAEKPQDYDVLLLDAFSGDAIPVHLLTVQAFELYLHHLKPDGVIALHASNHYLDLYPVMLKVAERLGLQTRYIIDDDGQSLGWERSEWMVFSKNAPYISMLPKSKVRDIDLNGVRLWTDDQTSLFEVFRWQ